jgi:hypothetical protein
MAMVENKKIFPNKSQYIFRWFSRTREMNVSTQEAEEKRKQLLAKELAIKRNLSLV